MRDWTAALESPGWCGLDVLNYYIFGTLPAAQTSSPTRGWFLVEAARASEPAANQSGQSSPTRL